MDVYEAKNIIKSLAAGVDPISGKPLAEGDICNRGDVIRAMYCIINEVERLGKLQGTGQNTSQRGAMWTSFEERKLVELFKSERCIEEICKVLNRSARAVENRMFRLGLISGNYFNSEAREAVSHNGDKPKPVEQVAAARESYGEGKDIKKAAVVEVELAKPTEPATTAKKVSDKKPPAEKAVKKPTDKTTTAKKPTDKKTTAKKPTEKKETPKSTTKKVADEA